MGAAVGSYGILEKTHSFVWGFAYIWRSKSSVDRYLFSVRYSQFHYTELLLSLDLNPPLASACKSGSSNQLLATIPIPDTQLLQNVGGT